VEPTDTIREAKVFLASRIAEEAEHEGAPLTEIERKALYFSESGWTLPDMSEVNERFEQEYDRRAYEKRIALLIRRARARLRAGDQREYQAWANALAALKEEEDHYLLTMIAGAQPEGEVARLVITALVVAGVMMLAIYLVQRGY
jgi:hypothetical protein